MVALTWNPSDKSADITLSNGNLSAITTTAAWRAARGTSSLSSSKLYFESEGEIFGWGTAGATLSNFVGSDSSAFGYSFDGQVYIGGSNVTTWDAREPFGGPVTKIGCLAIDLGAGRAWGRAIDGADLTGTWKGAGSSAGDPAAGTNGLDISSLGSTLYPMIGMLNTGNYSTTNFGARPFFGAVPSGFSGPDPSYPATYTAGVTQFTTGASSANVTLSQADLRAIRNAAGSATYYVGSVNKVLPVGSAGVYEFTVTAAPGFFDGFRIGLKDSTGSTTGEFGEIGLDYNGNVVVNGAIVGTAVAGLSFTLGDTVTVACNLKPAVKKVWFAVNGTFDGNPSAGTGGYDISSVTPSLALKAAVAFAGVPVRAVDANFGSRAFLATLPTGFVSYDAATVSGIFRSRISMG